MMIIRREQVEEKPKDVSTIDPKIIQPMTEYYNPVNISYIDFYLISTKPSNKPCYNFAPMKRRRDQNSIFAAFIEDVVLNVESIAFWDDSV